MFNVVYILLLTNFIYAQDLPQSIMEPVEITLATSYIEIMTCEMSPDAKTSINKALGNIERKERIAWLKSNTLEVIGTVPIAYAILSNIGDKSPLLISKSLNLKMGRLKAGLSSFAAGLAISGSAFYLGDKDQKDLGVERKQMKANEVLYALNQDDLEKVATRISNDVAILFSLNMEKKATIKSAVKRAIYDGGEITLGKVLDDANFQGQKVLTEEQNKIIKSIVENLNKLDQEESKQKAPTDLDRVGLLKVAKLDLEAKLNSLVCPDRTAKINIQIGKINSTLNQVDSALLLQKGLSASPAKERGKGGNDGASGE